MQVHGQVNQKMVRQALQWLQLHKNTRVLDLFCGLGNFSLPVARQVAEVVAVEGDAGLVTQARNNATNNQITNVTYSCADLFKLEGDMQWMQSNWDVVILDPPRVGAIEIIEKISTLNPRQILYISCHPGTLARDANLLVNSFGYSLKRVGILNMFPHTGHVETMALFQS